MITCKDFAALGLVALLNMSAAMSALAQSASPDASVSEPVESTQVAIPGLSSQANGRLPLPSATASLFAPTTAPPLSSVRVLGVYTPKYGWDLIAQGQLTNNPNKSVAGQPFFDVAVEEIGYGGNRVVSIAGAIVSSTKLFNTQGVCRENNVLTYPCTPGYTFVGWNLYYNMTGYKPGIFTFRDTAINYPFNTMSTSINIK